MAKVLHKSDINYQKKEKPLDQLHAQCSNPSHIKYKRFQLAKCYVTGGNKLLDIGCETGGLFEGLEEKFDSLVGIDVDSEALDFARKLHSNHPSIVFVKTDAYHLDFPDESFDFITCLDAIEHFEKPEIVLRQINRVHAPGGTLIITVPNWYDFLTSNPRHLIHHTIFGWEKLIKNAGYKITKCRAVDFPLIHSQFLAEYFAICGMSLLLVSKKIKTI